MFGQMDHKQAPLPNDKQVWQMSHIMALHKMFFVPPLIFFMYKVQNQLNLHTHFIQTPVTTCPTLSNTAILFMVICLHIFLAIQRSILYFKYQK